MQFSLKHVKTITSVDGTIKAVFDAGNGFVFEAGLFIIPNRDRSRVVCVSTQVGCAMGCKFCATSCHKFYRNLSASEIFNQVEYLIEHGNLHSYGLSGVEISLMGMGEPLANIRNCIDSIDLMHEVFPDISRISVSTVGPSSSIANLTNMLPSSVPIHLQLSLHATDEIVRNLLIPSSIDSIDSLIKSCRAFFEKSHDKVCINYIPLHGVNDSRNDAEYLSKLDVNAFYLKLTALNAVPGVSGGFRGYSLEELVEFSKPMKDAGVFVKYFVGDGLDINASCGQMASLEVREW